MTESTTEEHHAPAPAESAAAAEAPAETARPRGWRHTASSLLGNAAGGSAAGVPF